MKLEVQGGEDGTGGSVKEVCLSRKSHERPLRISSNKRDDEIYILKTSSNLLALSVKLVEFMYLLAVIIGINARMGEAS